MPGRDRFTTGALHDLCSCGPAGADEHRGRPEVDSAGGARAQSDECVIPNPKAAKRLAAWAGGGSPPRGAGRRGAWRSPLALPRSSCGAGPEHSSPAGRPPKKLDTVGRRTLGGYVALGVAAATCPCHLVLVVPVLAGTALGGWLARNYWLAFAGLTAIFVLSLSRALRSLRKSGGAPAGGGG